MAADFRPVSALASAPSPMRRHRFVQITCLFSTFAHTAATLICVYTFREGGFVHFSPAKLMQFVPEHLFLWRSCCLLVMLSSFSTLIFILAMREVLEEKYRFIVGVAVCLSMIACCQDFSAISRMMVLFADISLQGMINPSYMRQEIVLMGWPLINQSITETFLLASFLYGMGGLCIALCLNKTNILPRNLAYAHLPVWSMMIISSILTFLGYLPVAIIFVFTANLAISVLSAFSGVAIDAVLRSPLARAPGEPKVTDDVENSGFF